MTLKNIFVPLVVFLLFHGCTFINKQSFEIDYPNNSKSPEVVMNAIETYFGELGFSLQRKTYITYPNDERRAEFFLGTRRLPMLYTAYDHVILRLDDGKKLYIDWVRISDFKENPPPGYFDEFYRKVAVTLQERVGVQVNFRLVEQKKEP
jgi:hypothetical protein